MTASSTPGEVLVGEDDLRRHCERLLVAMSVPADQAETIADTLVEADLRGTHSHGAHLMHLYIGRMRAGTLEPVTRISTIRDGGSTAMLDAHLGFGQIAGVYAADLAVERARLHGLAAITVRETTHLGALAYYTRRAADRGCIAVLAQNGPSFVPPYGGLDGVFSTNPFSYAVPAGDQPSIVYDIATTAVAGNKILLAKKRGDPTIPEGWATDETGRPTTDTATASIDHLSWFGGHKGYGIAFLVELLGGVLADSCYGRTENTASTTEGRDRVAKGCCFIAIDAARFLPDGAFADRVDRLIGDVQSVRPAAGHDRVLVPGELEHRTRETRQRHGIPFAASVVSELNAFAEELGVDHRLATIDPTSTQPGTGEGAAQP